MGVLKPNFGNVNYSGAGQLNPLCNDPDYETIGIGTRIFVAGAKGYIVGEGTQHNPEAGMATLMIRADLKEVDPRFIKGATIYKYGCTLFIGIGVPIPILNERILRKTLVTDRDIKVDIVDYGVPRRERPVIKVTTYAELRSGKVEVNGVDVPAYPVSSYKLAREVAEELKRLIEKGEFYLTEPVERLPRVKFRPMAKKPIRRKTTWPKPRPFKGLVLDQEACIHCGYCIPVCPTGALSISNEDYTVRLDVSRCNLCGKCVDVCPVNALKLVG